MNAKTQSAASSTQFTSGYRAWLIILLILTYASNFMDRIIVATVGQAMKVDLQLSDLQLGLLGGMAFAFFYAVLGIPMARLSERYSRVKIIAACVAMWSLMTTLCGMAQNYAQLLLLRVGVGIGEAGSTPASHSLIADHFPPKRRASAFALYALGVPLGAFCGAILAGWIVQNMGWRSAFILLGLPGLLIALLTVLTLREPQRGLADGVVPTGEPVPSLKEVLRLLLRKRTFIHLTLGCALIGFANFGINMFMPIYFNRVFDMSYAQAGLAFGLITGVGALFGTSFGGFMADWAGKRDSRWYLWVVALGVALATPFYLAAFLQTNWIVAVAMMLVFGSVMYTWYGSTFAVTYTLVGPRMRASASAIVLLVNTLIGQGLGPIFIGGASDVFTRRAYAGGEYAASCSAQALEGAAAGTAQACTQAAATGIRYATVLCGLVFLWGALHYFLASRTLRQDQEPVTP
ncbi:spinster family MFS transporter [Luteimonas sp. RIT-PG2_3]